MAGVMLGAAFAIAAEAPGGLSRDQVWRSIFARPTGPAAPVDATHAARIALGAQLFNDPRLSGAGTHACRSCHQPERSFTDGLKTAAGRDGTALRRNTPHLYNLAASPHFFWDGRASSLEEQALGPLTADNELAIDLPRTLQLLRSDPASSAAFAAAFPETPQPSQETLLKALAAYEASLVSPPTRFDRWVEGDDAALDATEKDGFAIFVGKGGCVSCHGGWRFTDDQFHDIGLLTDDPGRAGIATGNGGIAAFKTPGLRLVSKTGPYMHDGSKATLADVVQHYAGGLTVRPSLAPNVVRDLRLDARERAVLIAFLRTL